MRKTFRICSRICELFLLCDAWLICIGLYAYRDMWPLIVLYWAMLTLKNLSDYLAGRDGHAAD